ncbi:tyrosinase cofactor [Streptomyces sp. BE147]|uniref:apotyrosinase chaperone MelC1 n=1 Tax=Streptomyces sp. BE147 TaxID=3002524 RepID=UPI002E79C389|nr:tyrosinase cofactor [Streptomyces sp. BE147]MEE1739690.1 tyrosinase cofactor [Streptomyces sp. BE147]
MSRLTRRQALGAVTGAAAGIALVGVATASADTAPDRADGAAGAPGGAGGPAPFDEVFQGRRIQGLPAEAHAHAGHSTGYRVLVDGRELHVMQHGKSGWSSPINHYERFTGPLDAARTAVTSLKGASVVPFDPTS